MHKWNHSVTNGTLLHFNTKKNKNSSRVLQQRTENQRVMSTKSPYTSHRTFNARNYFYTNIKCSVYSTN